MDDHLILLTDGNVEIMEANNIHFKYVTTFVIGNDCDLSVGAPFTHGSGSIIIEIKENYRNEIIGALSTDFSSLKEIDNINVVNKFNNIFNSL